MSNVEILVCGMLEKDGKVLFISRKEDGIEKFELPCIIGTQRGDPVSALAEGFRKQTDIKVEVRNIVKEGDFELQGGTEHYVIFGVESENKDVSPCGGYTGYGWFTFDEIKKKNVTSRFRWLRE